MALPFPFFGQYLSWHGPEAPGPSFCSLEVGCRDARPAPHPEKTEGPGLIFGKGEKQLEMGWERGPVAAVCAEVRLWLAQVAVHPGF